MSRRRAGRSDRSHRSSRERGRHKYCKSPRKRRIGGKWIPLFLSLSLSLSIKLLIPFASVMKEYLRPTATAPDRPNKCRSRRIYFALQLLL